MSLVTLRIVGTDGTFQSVPLDDISDTAYPIQKQAYGEVGTATLVSDTNPLPVLSREFLFEVSRGNIAGCSLVHKFGRNAAVGTTLTPVALGGIYRTPTAAVTLAAISTASADNQAGAGARELTLQYLDSNFALQNATLLMHPTDGTIESSDTVTDVIRLFRAYVSSSGSYSDLSTPTASHTGTITIRVSGGGATWATIEYYDTAFGLGQTQIGWYTIPAGKTGYILSTAFSVETNKSVDLLFMQRRDADDITSPYSALRLVQNYDGLIGFGEFDHKSVESYPEKTDIGFMVEAASSAQVSAEFELLLVDN